MRVRITEPMVADRGVLNVGDEIDAPGPQAAEWIRLGRAERIVDEPETAMVGAPEAAVTRRGRGRPRRR